MSSKVETGRVSRLEKFLKNWYPVILVIALSFAVVAIGDQFGNQSKQEAAQQAARNAQPDVQTNSDHCTILDKKTVSYKWISYYVSTSCGTYSTTENTFLKIHKGEVYDLVITKFHGEGTAYVTEASVSS